MVVWFWAAMLMNAGALQGQDLTATAVAAGPSCHNGSDGTITVFAQNGVPPYRYALNDEFGQYQSSNVFAGLSPGNYEVFVEDQAGYLFILTITVPNPPPVQVNLQNVVATYCQGGGGWTFGASGGTGSGYVFSLNGGAFQYLAGQSVSGIQAGSYEIRVRDANGCEAVHNVSVSRLPSISIDLITTVTPSCNINNGQIRVLSVVNEGNSVSYRLNDGPFQPFGTFNGLGPGTYSVTVRNEHGCTDVDEVVLPDPALAINVSVNVTPLSCPDAADGVVNAVVVGGGLPPYLYSLDGVDFQPSGFFNNLTDGDYLVFVQDAAGCMRIVETTVPAPPPLAFNPQINHAQCGQNNATLTLNASGGTPPYSFTFNGTVYSGSSTISGLAPGN
ncbi:MAG: SprB repeat-containing protein, partial [Bacteroidia bacterium]|nr:SprB repeat-containing protein [Bacteroidia bacterium]MDW8333748.1 SprB repeat-containing protein [Bacteroidia bacterium]